MAQGAVLTAGLPQRHHFRAFRSQSPRQRTIPNQRAEDWTSWPEVTVKLSGLPPSATTLDIYGMAMEEGDVVRIDFVEDHLGNLLGDAFVTFSPPPRRAFWNSGEEWKIHQDDESELSHTLALQLRPKQRAILHPSPINPNKFYPEHTVLYVAHIEFGYMHQPDQMMTMHSVASSSYGTVKVSLNLLRQEMVVEFPLELHKSKKRLKTADPDLIKFTVPFHQMSSFLESPESATHFAVTFTLENPPAFYKKARDISSTFDDSRRWTERQQWSRLTEIKLPSNESDIDGNNLDPWPLSLRRASHAIDIGRWTTYRLLIDGQGTSPWFYGQMKEILMDYNVKFHCLDHLDTILKTGNTVWDWIDRPKNRESVSFLEEMSSSVIDLKWSVRYQLESCISLGVFNERNIPWEFVNRLNCMSEEEAILRLEVAADSNARFFDPFDIFHLRVPRSILSRRVPSYCTVQRSVTVTPTTVYYSTPNVEMSNRVLRLFQEHEDRFIRVRFTGEKYEGRIHPTDEATQDAVFTRVYDCLTRGLIIGDRHFEFVAMGNSQFREHGAYFFASTSSLTAAGIRERLGQIGKFKGDEFVAERIVAKYTSRLGQCFSTTRPIRGTTIKVVEMADVERNGYNFTDGVGIISPFLVKLIALELQLQNGPAELPSVFQFRMGGIKGVVAVSKQAKNQELHIRPSQYKFPALYEGLEIIRWSWFSVARLNRQLIVVLRALGVPDSVFIRKLEMELSLLEEAMTVETTAQSILRQHVDYNRMTLTLANMIADGFMESRDPFCMSTLHLWRAWRTKQLREKAALTTTQGAFLLGCTDETRTLRGYFQKNLSNSIDNLEQKVDALPQIFVQISDQENPGVFKVIKGRCIVARNPSLHPGDIRVVEAVDVPDLHHLRDVVVFPQTGDRDIPGMCSGGDLDGDDFIVIWDRELIPPAEQWDNEAMDFTPPPPRTKRNGNVDIMDVISFFVTYMRTDTLRNIATSHLANADFYPQGVKHPKCLELARLHSIAVDYPKSGVPAPPIRKLRPPKYPHFMRNGTRPNHRYYHSRTVLGKLYDAVPQASFQPILHFPFDNRVLEAFQLDQSLLEKALAVKKQYDAAMRRIMAQHKIQTEFEVWTTFVMQHAQNSNDYKFGEEIGRISLSLKDQFVELCREQAGGKDYAKLAPFVAAMYTVTANEVKLALKQAQERANLDLESCPAIISAEEMPLMSFPWLFHHELGKISRGPRAATVRDIESPTEACSSSAVKDAFELGSLGKSVDEIVNDGKVTGRGDILQLFQRGHEVNCHTDKEDTPGDVMEDVMNEHQGNGLTAETIDESMEEGEVKDYEKTEIGHYT